MSYAEQGSETQRRGDNLKPTTTTEQDITTASQRRINLIWEVTQAAVAIMVVLANMVVGVYHGIDGRSAHEFPTILSSSLFLVIGFYFARTNHQATGGIGPKPNQSQEYLGR